MAFFTKLGETLTETSKDVSQKAKEIADLARLNMDLRKKEDFIQKQYLEIGKKYYELHEEDEDPLFDEIALIQEALQDIQKLEIEIAKRKGRKKCLSCGTLLDQDSMFCKKCGSKCDSILEEDMAENAEAAPEGNVTQEAAPAVSIDPDEEE